MKKFIVLSIAFAMFSLSFSFAQIKVRPGIVAGANYSTIGGKDVKELGDVKYTFGYHGGLMANIKLSEMVYVQPELLYSAVGGKVVVNYEDEDGEDIEETGTMQLNYINLPIKLKTLTKFGMCGMAGVEPGYLLTAKAKQDGESSSFKDQAKSFRMGWFVGVGYQSKAGIGIDVRYTDDFTSFLKEAKLKNSAFVASVYFQF